MLETASGTQAFSVGKPSPIMMRAARKDLGLEAKQTIMIGDTMSTDILGGVQLGYKTVLTLTGGTQRDELGRFAYTPDLVIDSLGAVDYDELLERLELAEEQMALAGADV